MPTWRKAVQAAADKLRQGGGAVAGAGGQLDGAAHLHHLGGDVHIFRHCAVHVAADDLGGGADVILPVRAGIAVHAGDDGGDAHQVAGLVIAEIGAYRHHFAADLVPQDDRVDVAGRGTVEVHALVRAADAAGEHADQ